MLARGHCPARNLVRKQVQHYGQIQTTTARSDVGDVRYPGLVGSRRVELQVQHSLTYQTAQAVEGNFVPSGGHGRAQTTAAVSPANGHKRGLQVYAGIAHRLLGLDSLVGCVIA